MSSKELTERETRFVHNVAVYGMSMAAAARDAGYTSKGAATVLMSREQIQAAIADQRAANARKMEMTRDKIIDGLAGAIDRAKILAQPMAEVAGWREIAKICGYYDTPPKGKDLSNKQQAFLDRISEMTDEELAVLTARDITFSEGHTIAGEAHPGNGKSEAISHESQG